MKKHALPQNLHILPKGHSVKRACGATTGGFVRERDSKWLKKFLRNGGGLCPECKKICPDLLKQVSP